MTNALGDLGDRDPRILAAEDKSKTHHALDMKGRDDTMVIFRDPGFVSGST